MQSTANQENVEARTIIIICHSPPLNQILDWLGDPFHEIRMSKLEYVLSRVEKHQAETRDGHKKHQSITTHPSSIKYTGYLYSTNLLLQDPYIFNEFF